MVLQSVYHAEKAAKRCLIAFMFLAMNMALTVHIKILISHPEAKLSYEVYHKWRSNVQGAKFRVVSGFRCDKILSFSNSLAQLWWFTLSFERIIWLNSGLSDFSFEFRFSFARNGRRLAYTLIDTFVFCTIIFFCRILIKRSTRN